MTPQSLRRRFVGSLSALALIVGVASGALAPAASAAPSAPAPSATAGLYGAADPTYDGVYRQSLAILGLEAIGAKPAPQAITWLLNQQCSDGSFEAFRSDLTTPCSAPDPKNFTGPDTNSTSLALMALMALQDNNSASPSLIGKAIDAAMKASDWLTRQQGADGGFPWTSGGASDANSTGLSLAAMLSMAPSSDFPAYKKATKYLGTLSSTCAAGGGLAFQSGGAANASATAQALVGIVGTLPVSVPRRVAVAAPCANTARAKAASFLSRTLSATGTLVSPYGTDPDYANTAAAVLGLVGAGQGRAAVVKATTALASSALAFATHSGGPDPGAIGLLLQVAAATGGKPTSFGGVNLVSLLTSSMRK